MTEDIITGLSRFRSLFVIARNSTFAYKGRSPNVQEVARALSVRYVLEGSVRRGGSRVRVTAQLIDKAYEAVALDPRDPTGLSHAREVLSMLGKEDMAIPKLPDAVNLNPAD